MTANNVRYIPVRSKRTLQRYMGLPGARFQINSLSNMDTAFGGRRAEAGDSYETQFGGWIHSNLAAVRSYIINHPDILACRIVVPVEVPHAE